MRTSETRDHFHRPRVAVTGVGIATPAGVTVSTLFDGILNRREYVREISRYDLSAQPARFGCEVTADLSEVLSAKEQKRLARSTQLGLFAGLRAADHAGVRDRACTAIHVGNGMGGLEIFEREYEIFRDKGPGKISPRGVPMIMPNATAAGLAMQLEWHGRTATYSQACASGAFAIAEGVRVIRGGEADVALCGGNESLLSPAVMADFYQSGAMSGRRGETRCRPFDEDRDGFVMSEGAAYLVLERWEIAVGRGAVILGEVLGCADNSDAFHVTAPVADGSVAAECMESALDDAGLRPADVMHVNAHGTGTTLNDPAEASAIASVFGDEAVPVTSVKGSTGHMLGASGACEAVVAAVCANLGLVPPVTNLVVPDEKLAPLDLVLGEARSVRPGPVLSNSFAFGGHNVCLVLGPAPEPVGLERFSSPSTAHAS